MIPLGPTFAGRVRVHNVGNDVMQKVRQRLKEDGIETEIPPSHSNILLSGPEIDFYTALVNAKNALAETDIVKNPDYDYEPIDSESKMPVIGLAQATGSFLDSIPTISLWDFQRSLDKESDTWEEKLAERVYKEVKDTLESQQGIIDRYEQAAKQSL
jgi:hypothetical protein